MIARLAELFCLFLLPKKDPCGSLIYQNLIFKFIIFPTVQIYQMHIFKTPKIPWVFNIKTNHSTHEKQAKPLGHKTYVHHPQQLA